MKKFNRMTEAQMSQAKGGDFGLTAIISMIVLAAAMGGAGVGMAVASQTDTK